MEVIILCCEDDGDFIITSVVFTLTMQSKHWCYTINNYKDEDLVEDMALFEYHVVGREIGDSGTPHLQGYVVFKKIQRLTGVLKHFPRAHLEVKKGTPQEAADYCKEDGLYLEQGTLPLNQTGGATLKRKADYELAINLAKKQKLYEIESGVLIRHMSALKQVARDFPPEMDTNDYLCGVWFYGAPGTGKSKTARWLYPNAYPKMC
uniref:hypothetical protein n=1 Tax=Flavobacterium sp. TaxID=239 RepID=UPI004048C459